MNAAKNPGLILGAAMLLELSLSAQTNATHSVTASASAVAIVQPAPASAATNQAGAPPKAPEEPAIPGLAWAQVKPLHEAKKIVLIDARPKPNFDIGHIPGAINLPGTSSLEELRAFAEKYPRDTALVLYCGSEQCHTSHQLAVVLVKIFAYTNVRDMPGGFVEFLNSSPDATPEKN